jgi:hypothetical protein
MRTRGRKQQARQMRVPSLDTLDLIPRLSQSVSSSYVEDLVEGENHLLEPLSEPRT